MRYFYWAELEQWTRGYHLDVSWRMPGGILVHIQSPSASGLLGTDVQYTICGCRGGFGHIDDVFADRLVISDFVCQCQSEFFGCVSQFDRSAFLA